MSPTPDPTPILDTRAAEARIATAVAGIRPVSADAAAAARARQDQLTKPAGSLGQLEALAIRLAGITGVERPRLPRKAVIVMAADHGVARAGVSAFPPEVTPQMVLNFLRGGAAINVLARQAGARVVVVDMGVATPLPADPNLRSLRIGPGTADMTAGPAMTRRQALAAVAAGIDVLEAEVDAGLDLVATGDMGIGNTTPSSAIVATLTGLPVATVTGRGTGVDDAGLARKVAAIERALEVNRPDPDDALDVLRTVGGFEIGGLAGVMIGAAAHGLPVLVDGFISGAAALVAAGIAPAATTFMVATHVSVEIGHRVALERLALEPLLDLGLRLGEGTGAAIAMHLVDDALAIHDEMATFAEAAVAGRIDGA